MGLILGNTRCLHRLILSFNLMFYFQALAFMPIFIIPALELPYRLGFNVDVPGLNYFDYVIDVLFAIDIILNFNTTYDPSPDDVFENILEEKRTNIACRYLTFWFWIDLVATVPFDLLLGLAVSQKSSNFLTIRLIRTVRFLRLLKLVRLVKLKRIVELLDDLNINPAVIGIFVLLTQILFLVHIICCIWYYIASPASGADPVHNWITQSANVENSSKRDIYVAAFYFIVATMTTVGYGDIHAYCFREQVFLIFFIPILAIMFGAIINKVTKAILYSNPQASALKSMMDDLKGYLSEKCVPTVLKDDAVAAYVYFFKKKSLISECGVFEDLPKPLLIKLVQSIYKEEISTIDLFKKCKEHQFVVDLLIKSKPFQARAGDVVADVDDIADEVFFIMKGVVTISSSEGTDHILAGYCTQGGYFGDFEYLKRTTRIARYTAVQVTDLLSVPYNVITESITNHFDTGMMFVQELQYRYDLYQTEVMEYRNKEKNSPKMCSACFHTYSSSADKKEHGAEFLKTPRICSACFTSCGSESCYKGHLKVCAGTHAILEIERNDEQKEMFLKSFSDQIKLLKKSKLLHLCRERGISDRLNIKTSNFLTHTEREIQERLILISRLIERAREDSHAIKTKRRLFVDGKELFIDNSKGKLSVFSKRDEIAEPDVEEITDEIKSILKKIEEQDIVSQEYVITMNEVNSRGKVVIVEKNVNTLGPRLLLYHKGFWKKRWDLFIGFLIVYSVVIIPVELAFQLDSSTGLNGFDTFVTIMFFLDICAWFRTTYEDLKFDLIETIPSRLALKYIKNWFVIDAISTIPFDQLTSLFVNGNSLFGLRIVRVMRLTKLLRMFRLTKLTRYLEKWENISGMSPALFDLFRGLLIIFLCAHFFACFWWGMTSAISSYPWYEYPNMYYENSRAAEKYVASLYWTLVTIDSVGYGDIYAQNSAERMLTIFIFLVGTTFFGYMVATVSSLASSLNRSSAIVTDRIAEISAYLQERNCSRELSMSIKKYFNKYFETATAYDENSILQHLPTSIRNEILFIQHSAILNRIAIFEHISNRTIVLFVFEHMKMRYYDKDQVVVREGNPAHGIFFMISGTAIVTKAVSKDALQKKQLLHQQQVRAEFYNSKIPIKSTSEPIDTPETSVRLRRRHSLQSIDLEEERRRSVIRYFKTPAAQIYPSFDKESAEKKSVYHKGDLYLGHLIPGQFVGHIGIMRRESNEASVTSISGSTYYTLTKAACHKIISDHPGVAFTLQTAIGKASGELAANNSTRDFLHTRKKFLMSLKTHNVAYNKKLRLERAKLKSKPSRQKQNLKFTFEDVKELNLGKLRDVTMENIRDIGGKLNLTTLAELQRQREERRSNAEARWDRVRVEIKTASLTTLLGSVEGESKANFHASSAFSKVFKAQTGVGIDEICQIELSQKRDLHKEKLTQMRKVRYNTYTDTEQRVQIRRHNSLPNIYLFESIQRSTSKTEKKFKSEPQIKSPPKEYVREFIRDVVNMDYSMTQGKQSTKQKKNTAEINPGGEYEDQLFVKRRVDRRMSFPLFDEEFEDWKGLMTDKCVL